MPTFKSHQYISGFQGTITLSKGLKQTEVSLSFSDNLHVLISYLTGYMIICQKNKFDKNKFTYIAILQTTKVK